MFAREGQMRICLRRREFIAALGGAAAAIDMTLPPDPARNQGESMGNLPKRSEPGGIAQRTIWKIGP